MTNAITNTLKGGLVVGLLSLGVVALVAATQAV